jgi:Holliday junction resolvase RusA-like endonuclease
MEAVRQIKFVAYCTPQPQGSMKGFVLPGKNGAKGRAILTSANPKLKPYRGEITREAMSALSEAGITEPMAAKHVPVSLIIDFYLARPASIPRKRTELVVKPDLSKLIRSTEDAMTGILYADDAQIVELSVRKHYGSPERVEISARIQESKTLF